MVENNNETNIEIKADLTETINKAYDDTIHPIASSTKSGLSFCINFLASGIKPYMYKKIKESEYRIQEIDKELEQRYNKIPDENKTDPRTNILGPAIDVLKYNLDEEHIRQMFTNILISEMDSRKQNKVLPAYIEVVKQLSKEDALFLNELKTKKLIKTNPIIKLKLTSTNSKGFQYISNYYICLDEGNFISIPQIVLDNLLRLKIVDIPFDESNINKDIYTATFNNLIKSPNFSHFNSIPNKCIKYHEGNLHITDFGRNFIDICLS